MATQQELDDAVILAAQQLSQQLALLDQSSKQLAGFQAARDAAAASVVTQRATTKDLRDQVKTGAVALNAAIVAANAGPTP